VLITNKDRTGRFRFRPSSAVLKKLSYKDLEHWGVRETVEDT
jgi:hypothetical protein